VVLPRVKRVYYLVGAFLLESRLQSRIRDLVHSLPETEIDLPSSYWLPEEIPTDLIYVTGVLLLYTSPALTQEARDYSISNETASHHIYIVPKATPGEYMYGKAASLWSADEGADPARYAFSDFAASDLLMEWIRIPLIDPLVLFIGFGIIRHRRSQSYNL